MKHYRKILSITIVLLGIMLLLPMQISLANGLSSGCANVNANFSNLTKADATKNGIEITLITRQNFKKGEKLVFEWYAVDKTSVGMNIVYVKSTGTLVSPDGGSLEKDQMGKIRFEFDADTNNLDVKIKMEVAAGVVVNLKEFQYKVACIAAPKAPNATEEPGEEPTGEPTIVFTSEPTFVPTDVPTDPPTTEPTGVATEEATSEPTDIFTVEPTSEPTDVATQEATSQPTDPPLSSPEATFDLTLGNN